MRQWRATAMKEWGHKRTQRKQKTAGPLLAGITLAKKIQQFFNLLPRLQGLWTYI
jgi:hypothetical protein